MFDFVGEIGSGPRFIYMAFPWLFSRSYREEIRLEYKGRNKIIAWAEFSLAVLFFVFWMSVGTGIVLMAIKNI